ncbi:glutamate carboxypeptidase [Rhodococcus sp. OAS809]|jgi:glutamate carboxypeptidase|uniref:M20 family metallopeptidase n=1 Tax=Rhodococcus sp. OAS809 TaxID=2663874 RepID=UPI00178A287E
MRPVRTSEDAPAYPAVVRAILADLRRLVETESPSSDLDAVEHSAHVVAELVYERLGRRPEILCVQGVHHVLLRGSAARVMILAHHDTVWPLGTITDLPYSEADGIIRGPGCFDMKLGLAQSIHALRQLTERRGDEMLEHVTLLVTGDEELGSPTSREIIENEARRCFAVFVLEAAGSGGALKTERKGVSRYQIEIIGRAAHSGLEPEKGINATIAAAEVILQIAELADQSAGTTATPTVLSSGTAPNTVPAKAVFDVDVRATTAREQQRVDQSIRAINSRIPGAEVVVHGGINRPPMEHDAAISLFRDAQRIACTLGQDPLREISVGGASDGNFTAGLGVPTLDGMGAVGGGAHARDEHAEIAWILPRTELLRNLMEELVDRSG